MLHAGVYNLLPLVKSYINMLYTWIQKCSESIREPVIPSILNMESRLIGNCGTIQTEIPISCRLQVTGNRWQTLNILGLIKARWLTWLNINIQWYKSSLLYVRAFYGKTAIGILCGLKKDLGERQKEKYQLF